MSQSEGARRAQVTVLSGAEQQAEADTPAARRGKKQHMKTGVCLCVASLFLSEFSP